MKKERAFMFHRSMRIFGYIAATLWLLTKSSSVAALCRKEFTHDGIERSYLNCSDLLMQDASIAWSYINRSNMLAVAFSGRNIKSGWVGWGINPDCSRMVGSSVLITFGTTDGTAVAPYKLNSNLVQGIFSLQPGRVDFDFRDRSSSISGTDFTIFATLRLKPNQTKIRMVWNRGPFMSDPLTPSAHFLDEESLGSVAVLDVIDNSVTKIGDRGCPVVVSHRHQKKKHGVIAGVAWGILYPLGIILGWFTLFFPATYLYVYVPYHIMSFAFGMAGFYSGSMLNDLDGSVNDSQHHFLAVFIVVLGTLQLLLFILRTGSTTGIGGDVVRHLKTWFCTYNFMLAFGNFFLIAAELFSGIQLFNPTFEWGIKWLVISGLVFSLYICNCAGMQNYRRHLRAPTQSPQSIFAPFN